MREDSDFGDQDEFREGDSQGIVGRDDEPLDEPLDEPYSDDNRDRGFDEPSRSNFSQDHGEEPVDDFVEKHSRGSERTPRDIYEGDDEGSIWKEQAPSEYSEEQP